MLISQIVQLDAQSNEFARKHAVSQIERSDGGESFADYLAATMNPETDRSEADDVAASARDRTPEKAYRQDVRADEATDDPVARDATRSKPEKPRDTNGPTEDSSAAASRAEKAKSEEVAVPLKKPDGAHPKTGEAKPPPGSKNPRDLSVEAASATPRKVGSEAGEKASARRADTELDDKASRVRSRRVSEAKVEIDVRMDVDDAVAAKESTSAKKSGSVSGASGDSESEDVQTKKVLVDRTRNESARDSKASRGSIEERAETALAARSKSEKAEKAGDSDDRSTRADRRVEVRDLRSGRAHERNNGDTRDGSDGRRGSGGTTAGNDASLDVEAHNSRSATDRATQFETLRAEGGPTSAASRGGESSTRAMSGTAANLRQTLQESLNAEIVRSARLVVRGNGSGEIRLNLRPDSLGNVRISLQMQDGHIAGRIIVDNQTVREVFEQNLASLQKAFEENGLEAGGVEISLADSGDQAEQRPEEAPHRASVREVADQFGYSVPDLSTIDEYHDLVDVVV